MEIQRFDSLAELLDFAENAPAVRPVASQASRRVDSWGDASFPEAVDLARKGWTAGVAQIERLREALFNSIVRTVEKPMPYFDVEGGPIDMGRFLEGDPECILGWRMQEASDHRIIHCWINTAMSSGVDSDAIASRGAAIACLIDALEASGFRAQIDICSAVAVSSSSAAGFATIVRIKNASEPLNLEALAFTLMHPAMERRILFAAQERTSPATVHKFHFYKEAPRPNYGMPANYELPTADLNLNTAMRLDHPSDIRKWVLDMLRKQGVRIVE